MQGTKLTKQRLYKRNGKHYWYYFICECGAETIKRVDTKAKSCGCLPRKVRHKTQYIDNSGYIMKSFDGKTYRREHRKLIEDYIGRKLLPDEHVHHINKVKTDNRIENLMIVDINTHNKLDNGWVLKSDEWWKDCPMCGNHLKVSEENFYKCAKQFFYKCIDCSNKLSTK